MGYPVKNHAGLVDWLVISPVEPATEGLSPLVERSGREILIFH